MERNLGGEQRGHKVGGNEELERVWVACLGRGLGGRIGGGY